MGRYSEAAERAAELTNKQLKERISSLNTMDDKKVQKLFPTRDDKAKFVELMARVESETSDANKISYLTQNISNLAPVILKSLKYFA